MISPSGILMAALGAVVIVATLIAFYRYERPKLRGEYIFRKRTYRKVRAKSIQRIMNTSAWWERTQHPSYPAHIRQSALEVYDYEVRLGTAIVARARREKGMYKS